MNLETETVSATRIKLSVSVSKEERDGARRSITRKYVAEKALKGFRKGKAPEELVAATYAADIAEDALNKCVNDALKDAAKDLKVQERVSIDDFKDGDDGSFSFTVVFDMEPEFELPPHEGIPVDNIDTAVTDGDVAEFVESLRKNNAKFEDFTPDTAAAGDDFLVVSYEGFIDGQPLADVVPDAGTLAKSDTAWCAIGNENYRIPGLPQGLAGAKLGEERSIAVSFPEDYAKESLRGKNAEYKVMVQSGRHSVTPELDEAFAKAMGVEGVDALMATARERLEHDAKERDSNRRRNQILTYLVSNASFEVPQAAFERAVEASIGQLVDRAMMSGMSKEDVEARREDFLAQSRKIVLDDMRLDYMARKLAAALDVKVSSQELNNAFASFAAERRMDKKQIDAFVKQEGRLRWLHGQTLRLKLTDALLEKAVRTDSISA